MLTNRQTVFDKVVYTSQCLRTKKRDTVIAGT